MKNPDKVRSGYAAIAGSANSGKSALINALSCRNISPSYNFNGTTRIPISSIYMTESDQICFIDTPPLDYYEDEELFNSVDVICLTLNSTELSIRLKSPILRSFISRYRQLPIIFVPTFIDYFPAELHGAFTNQISMSVNYQEIVPVCAPCDQGIKRLRRVILKYIPERGKLFPDGCTSLHSERFLVSEQIRISLFNVLPSEIAATTAVQIEEFSIRDEKRYVRANLHVARHSNKGVVIGRKGAMLQNIADIASKGASRIIERPLYLDLWVKVRESWPENRDDLIEFGYVY
ncbi:MAG: 50S ribosome-binding GTPase [Candidatus Aegiribacteria sp.]|nr:50S ribosome-binding GTPase [Candidatus Aegiribacteria sp.]